MISQNWCTFLDVLGICIEFSITVNTSLRNPPINVLQITYLKATKESKKLVNITKNILHIQVT